MPSSQSKGPRQEALGCAPITPTLIEYAIPSVVAQVVSALYNIVDQFFIGQSVGQLGNAATNVAFPLTQMCMALSLMMGVGGAASFNLAMGSGRRGEAGAYVGQSAVLMLGVGAALTLLTQTLLEPILTLCGATSTVLPYAETFTRVTSLGFPFLILMAGGTRLISADGSPRYSMACTLSGAIINLVVNPVLVFGLGMGILGSAIATVVGQVVAGIMVIAYLLGHFTSVKLSPADFVPRPQTTTRICSIGFSPFVTQLLNIVMQITLNNSLTSYGARSVYGADMPLAVAGIAMKMNQLAMSIVTGISQGMQPLISYNYGAGNYGRVRGTYLRGALAATLVSLVAFALFHLFPDQLIGMFGQTDPLAVEFAEKVFRIYLFFTFLNAIQPLTANLFSSIGRPLWGIAVSFLRQGIFFIPLMLALPTFMGIEGVIWAAPIADLLTFCTTSIIVRREFVELHRLERDATRTPSPSAA